jgi:hypothetical protein
MPISVPLSDCIAPSFYDLHKQLKKDESVDELWLRGGRASCLQTV